ncbi:MAG: cell division protein FtsA [Acidobacteriia bacterium]|nr:cell division protein FtsA [Terriglobia bacterium]
MTKDDRFIVGLDVGTTETRALICEVATDGHLEVAGFGHAESKGLRQGVVVKLDEAVQSIKKALEEAELMAGVQAESVYVSLGGKQIKSLNSQGAIAVLGRNREITREDIRRVLEAAQAVALPSDREITHVLRQQFIVDEQDGIDDPLGMLGTRLEVSVHIITSPVTAAQNVVTAANRSGAFVKGTVLQSLAAAEATLAHDEKELGVALVAMGSGTTDLAIFLHGSVWHTSVVPIGGEHITSDLAVGLRTPIPEAERLKQEQGCAMTLLVTEDREVEVSGVGSRRTRTVPRKLLCDIVQPRVEEILSHVRDEIRNTGLEKQLGSGVVITGGNSKLHGMVELAEQILNLPVRQGVPEGLNGLNATVINPSLATTVGLVRYGNRIRMAKQAGGRHASGLMERAVERLKNIFQ